MYHRPFSLARASVGLLLPELPGICRTPSFQSPPPTLPPSLLTASLEGGGRTIQGLLPATLAYSILIRSRSTMWAPNLQRWSALDLPQARHYYLSLSTITQPPRLSRITDVCADVTHLCSVSSYTPGGTILGVRVSGVLRRESRAE